MKLILLFILIVPAMTNANCTDLNKFKLGLEVHASNWANARTTRTPEGGGYKFKSLNCQKNCKIVEEEKFYLKYEPDHPDTNTNGYVKYPVIEKEKERAAITAYAKSIHMLASSCKSKVTTVKNTDSLLIKYKLADVRHDIFNFDKSNKVVSWIREDINGKSHILNF